MKTLDEMIELAVKEGIPREVAEKMVAEISKLNDFITAEDGAPLEIVFED